MKKVLKKGEINIIYTDFKKEISSAKRKLETNVNLQKYFARNHLFELKKRAKKQEEILLKWLNDLIKGYEEYLTLL